jgi:hypothetical protein
VFRDSRGVVHTVTSADPLEDLPRSAAVALAGALLVPSGGDLGSTLERCEALAALLGGWQDAFFAGLPSDVDLDEEARYAAEAGLSLEEIEAANEDWEEDDEDLYDEPFDGDSELPGQLGLDDDIEIRLELDLDDHPALLGHAADPLTAILDEDLVASLERDLLLLPMRVRLEALIAATQLVETWAELLADHEKCLGHLVLCHGYALPTDATELAHEVLADEHARAHAGDPDHPA